MQRKNGEKGDLSVNIFKNSNQSVVICVTKDVPVLKSGATAMASGMAPWRASSMDLGRPTSMTSWMAHWRAAWMATAKASGKACDGILDGDWEGILDGSLEGILDGTCKGILVS